MLTKFSKILVVDDSPTTRKIVCQMMNNLGFHNILQAEDGHSALSILNERNFALVISDLQMEPMGGLELLQELRKRPSFAATPFIMMTAYAVRFAAIARDDGGLLYLIKPFKQEQLLAKILHATTGIAA